MVDFDHGYKRLFSNPEMVADQMVADLLRGFVNEPWVNELDFSSLRRVSSVHIVGFFSPEGTAEYSRGFQPPVGATNKQRALKGRHSESRFFGPCVIVG